MGWNIARAQWKGAWGFKQNGLARKGRERECVCVYEREREKEIEREAMERTPN